MLVLERSPGEQIRINLPDGRHVDVMVTSVRGAKVRLGISAPAGVGVDRMEVWTRKNSDSDCVFPAAAELPGSTSPTRLVRRYQV